MNGINLSPMISSGAAYRLGERGKLRLAPVFRYGVLRTNDTPIGEYLWSAGLDLGYYMHF